MNQYSLPQVVTEFSLKIKKLPVSMGMARFLKNNQTILDVSYGIPWKELKADSILSGNIAADLELAWAIRDSSYQIMVLNKRQSRINHSIDLSTR